MSSPKLLLDWNVGFATLYSVVSSAFLPGIEHFALGWAIINVWVVKSNNMDPWSKFHTKRSLLFLVSSFSVPFHKNKIKKTNLFFRFSLALKCSCFRRSSLILSFLIIFQTSRKSSWEFIKKDYEVQKIRIKITITIP